MDGEHRQITVMFCDLVGSTQLSSEMDPEDLRDILLHYQTACAGAIERSGGMVARYMGDGLLAYFGYPRASEHAPVHATEAGLEALNEIAELNAGPLRRHGVVIAARIALHTGRVLVSEMGAGATRESVAVTGVAPNLAARIEQLAPENAIAISGATNDRIAGAFETESMGTHLVKGIPDPLEVFRVTGKRIAETVLPAPIETLIGRLHEVQCLHSAWEAVTPDSVQVACVVGEPGVGKSALASAFIAAAGIDPDQTVELVGTVADRNTPFSGLKRYIERLAGPLALDDPAGLADHLEARLGLAGPTSGKVARSFADALTGSVPAGEAGRTLLFDAFAAYMQGLGPRLLVVFEDAHWADPSTVEMLAHARRTTQGWMQLMLTRPGVDLGLTDVDAEFVHLGGLDDDASAELVSQFAGSTVDADLARKIVETTDGVPLFVEEYMAALIASGQVRQERGRIRYATALGDIETPTSLLDLLTARLDSLGPGKEIAQIAAVLGRRFDVTALEALSGRARDGLEVMLNGLVDMGILSPEPGGLFEFRHALFQKASYESMVRTRRRVLHERYLDWLAEGSNRVPAPESLAHHCLGAGRLEDAIDHLMQAGEAANSASASKEAARHFQQAAAALTELDDNPDVSTRMLQVQVLLAGALLSANGPGSAETRDAYESALTLARRLPETQWHFPAYWGWWRTSESFAQMAERARRIVSVSERMSATEFKLQAQHCLWANAFQMGELDESLANARTGLALYEAGGAEHHGTLYGGHDAKVCALGEVGLIGWLQGKGDAACQEVETAIEHAERLGHLGSILHGLDIAVMLHHYRRDSDDVRRVAERLRELAAENDLEEYTAKADIFLGWCAVDTGDVSGGLAQIEAGFRVMQAVGTPEDFPVYQCMRADAMIRLGALDSAEHALAQARATVASEGVNYWGAEIARHAAELEMARSIVDPETVRGFLRDAKATARAQGALALELRGALSSARWLVTDDETRTALLEVLARFPDDAKGRDIDDARRLLAQHVSA